MHHYGADVYSRALDDRFEDRLGLTATFEREDDGVDNYLEPYFRPLASLSGQAATIVASCSYARGLEDGILAPYRIGLIGVNLTAEEQADYDLYDEQARTTQGTLIAHFGLPPNPFGEYMKAVSQLSEGNKGNPKGTALARRYLSAFTKRRALLAASERKLVALESLVPILRQDAWALIFTETIESAQAAARLLTKLGVATRAFSSNLTQQERKALLSDFRTRRVRALAAPRVLDEGIDLPDADIGIVVAASRSRRQMIQRMGRIIRPKSDGRLATFFILYVQSTSEDPQQGAHGGFLNEMNDTAQVVKYFRGLPDEDQLLQWYVPG